MPPYWDNKALKHWCCFRKIVCKITDTSKVPFLHTFSVFKHWDILLVHFTSVYVWPCAVSLLYIHVSVCVCVCVCGWVSLRARAPRGDPSWWSQLSSGASRQVSDRSLRWPDFIIAPAPVIESQQCVCVCMCVFESRKINYSSTLAPLTFRTVLSSMKRSDIWRNRESYIISRSLYLSGLGCCPIGSGGATHTHTHIHTLFLSAPSIFSSLLR